MIRNAEKKDRKLDLLAVFVDGYASGWRFAVSEAFKDFLDIKLTPRVEPLLDANGDKIKIDVLDDMGNPVLNKDGKPKQKYATTTSYVWTQGEEYSFTAGCILYDTPLAYQMKWGEALHHIKLSVQIWEDMPDGTLRFKLYKPKNDFSKVEELEVIECTQKAFIEFLKTGIILTNDCVVRNLHEEHYPST